MKRIRDLNEPHMKLMLNKMGAAIEHTAAACDVEKPLFALIIFDDPGLGQYVCNCERKSAIAALRETADRLERNEVIER